MALQIEIIVKELLVVFNCGHLITMNTESKFLTKAISNKGEKRKNYLMEFKNDVVEYAKKKKNSNKSAAKILKIDRKRDG